MPELTNVRIMDRRPEFSSLAAGPSVRLQLALAAREEEGEVAVDWPGILEEGGLAIVPYQVLPAQIAPPGLTRLRICGGLAMGIGGLSGALTALWQFRYMILEGFGWLLIIGGVVLGVRALRS